MGIVRTVEWKLVIPPQEAADRLSDALNDLGMEAMSTGSAVQGKASRSLLKNRWAADAAFELEPLAQGTLVVARVEMNGTKHYAMLDEVAEKVGDDAFDDRGVADAVQRLGKMGRIFGRKEVRHVRNLLHGDERVIILGQGQYSGKQGLVVLTNERLFFFEKSMLGQETIEQFALKTITSLETGKKMTGEKLIVTVSGNRSEITHMFHGQADEIVRQYRRLAADAAQATAPAAPAATTTNDPIAQLQQIAALRDQGIISEAEFEQKKAELMSRI